MSNNQKNDRNEVLGKMQHICSEREKCRSDIAEKLRRYSLSASDIQWILHRLEEDRFIDENRYAGFYARDKFRFNRWGRIKIRTALGMKKISKEIINEALKTIDENEYRRALQETLQAKQKHLKEKNTWKRKARLFQFAASKGFEHDLIYEVIDEISNGEE